MSEKTNDNKNILFQNSIDRLGHFYSINIKDSFSHMSLASVSRCFTVGGIHSDELVYETYTLFCVKKEIDLCICHPSREMQMYLSTESKAIVTIIPQNIPQAEIFHWPMLRIFLGRDMKTITILFLNLFNGTTFLQIGSVTSFELKSISRLISDTIKQKTTKHDECLLSIQEEIFKRENLEDWMLVSIDKTGSYSLVPPIYISTEDDRFVVEYKKESDKMNHQGESPPKKRSRYFFGRSHKNDKEMMRKKYFRRLERK